MEDSQLTIVARQEAEEKWKKYIFYGAVAVGVIGISVGSYYFLYHRKENNEHSHDKDKNNNDDDDNDRENSLDLDDPVGSIKKKSKNEMRPLKRIPSDLKRKHFEMELDDLTDKEGDDSYMKELKKYRRLKKELEELRVWNYRHGVLRVIVVKAINLNNGIREDENNAYLKLKMGKQKHRTTVKPHSKNMEWNEVFEFNVNDATKDILLVKARNKIIGGKDGKLCDDFCVLVTDIITQHGRLHNYSFRLTGTENKAEIVLDFSYDEF